MNFKKNSMPDPETTWEDLKSVAAKLSIDFMFTDLSSDEINISSGFCKLKGQNLIVLDKHLSLLDQIEIVLETLKEFDLEEIYIPIWIRECLENPTPSRIIE